MPRRIYDISKKLGLDNKVIIAKAQSLNITTAKVASSSIDNISADYLEEELIKDHPEVAARLAPKPVVEKPKPVVEEKIVVIHAPEPEPEPVVEIQPEPEPIIVEEIVAEVASAPTAEISEPAQIVVPPPAPKVVIPAAPVVPPRPQMGEKVGFIQLAPRPGSGRPGERGSERGGPPPRPPVAGGRPGQPMQGGRPGSPPQRGGQFQQRGRDGRPMQQSAPPPRPAAPQQPKFSLPSDAQIITIKPPIVVRALAEAL